MTLPVDLLVLELETGNRPQLVSQAQLANVTGNYIITDTISISDERQRFQVYEADSSPIIITLLEAMDLNPDFGDPAPPPLPPDPFDYPLDELPNIIDPLKSFYIYDERTSSDFWKSGD